MIEPWDDAKFNYREGHPEKDSKAPKRRVKLMAAIEVADKEIKLPIEERADGLLKPDDKSEEGEESADEPPPPVKRKPGRPPKNKTGPKPAPPKKTPKKRQPKGENAGEAANDNGAKEAAVVAAQEEEEEAAGPTLSKEEIKAKVASRKTPKKKGADEGAIVAGAPAKKAPKATVKYTKVNGSDIDSKRRKEIELVVPHKSVKSADIREMTEEAAKKKLNGPKVKTKKDKGDYKVGDLTSFAGKMARLHAKESSRNNDELVGMMQELFKETLMYRSDVERSGLAAVIASLRKSLSPTVGQAASALRKHMIQILNHDTDVSHLGKKSHNDAAAYGTKKRKAENGGSVKSEENQKKSSNEPPPTPAANGDAKENSVAQAGSPPAKSPSPTKQADTVTPKSESVTTKVENVVVKEENTVSKPAEVATTKTVPRKDEPVKSEPAANKAKEPTEDNRSAPTPTEVEKSADGEVKDKEDIFEAPEHMDTNRKIFVDMLSKILDHEESKRGDLAQEIESWQIVMISEFELVYVRLGPAFSNFTFQRGHSSTPSYISKCKRTGMTAPFTINGGIIDHPNHFPIGLASSMARANLLLSAELARAFADAQSGQLRFVKVSVADESFVLSGAGPATGDPRADVAQLAATSLSAQQAAFVLLCPDTRVAALRWVLLAFVPEGVSVRDRMLYSSSRDSLKKQLGANYFSGEFHATELVTWWSEGGGARTGKGLTSSCCCTQSEVTWENFLEARKKQAADAPLSESERLLKEAALLERDTNVKSSAMGVVPFEVTQNVRDKLRLLQDNKFDWIAMVRRRDR
ncbi:unnamed protein product [Phytophthora fragariaefolia]|uniref:Unnamed protein product n=1 Tax=Phytophthora fragariaefolia TaxID=1490495 RepID=A0A9W6Y263_9STRA|nr:unnamed protein product [Phytophthora fragariaefolia]